MAPFLAPSLCPAGEDGGTGPSAELPVGISPPRGPGSWSLPQFLHRGIRLFHALPGHHPTPDDALPVVSRPVLQGLLDEWG